MTISRFKSQVQKHALTYFFVLAFILSWFGWGMNLAYVLRWTSSHSIIFTLLGGLGPVIAAIVISWILSGLKGVGQLLGALFRKGAKWVWFLLALILQPLITTVVLGIERLLPGPNMDLTTFPGMLPFLVLFIGMLATNVWEEIGWRGFALPRLQSRFSPLISSLILGFFTSLWHLPLLLNPTEEMAAFPIWAQLPYTLALSILYTWLYNGGNGNLTVVTLFHGMANAVALTLMLGHPDITTHYLINAAITILAALGIAAYQLSTPRKKKKVAIA